MKNLNALIAALVILLALLPVGLVKAVNWVEVARFEGNRTTMNYDGCVNYTAPFTIDRSEWRIKWEYEPDFMVSKKFDVYVYRQGETTNYIAHINPAQEGYSGIYSIHNTTGSFYLKITYSIVESYSLIVEQNIDSELLTPTSTPLILADPTPTSASPSIVWQQTFGQGTSTSASSVTQTTDGGYALAGTVILNSLGEIEYWVAKTDSLGNQQWSINGLQQPGFGPASSIVQTPDDGYAFVGGYGSFYVPSYLIKTDSQGEIQYNQSYSRFSFSSLQISGDGDFVMAGYQNKSFALAKANSTGSIEWSHTYGGSEDNKFGFVSLVTTNDGGYALAGSAQDNSETWAVLIKTDSSGNMLWSQKYSGNSGNLQARALTQSRQGGFVFAGLTGSSNTTSACIFRVDEQGRMLWNQTYAEVGEEARSVVETLDGGFAFACSWGATANSNLAKVDSNGSLQWVIPCGGTVTQVLQTSDGAYALAGIRDSRVWFAATTIDTATPLMSPTPTTSHQSVSPTLSPSPSIPEFPLWITVALGVVVCVLVLFSRRSALRN